MRTITTRVTDGAYESLTREAAKRGVSIHEIIADWLLEGEQWLSDDSPEILEAFYAREGHHMADIRALSEWHESLAKQLRPPA